MRLKLILGLIIFITYVPILYASKDLKCQKLGIEGVNQCQSGSGANVVYTLSNMPYALCSKALCTYKNSNYANCTCSVESYSSGWKSMSMSPTDYNSSKPTYNPNKLLQTVQSNFSLANTKIFPTKYDSSYMEECKNNKNQKWASCYGVRCTVTQTEINGKKTDVANCVCPIEHSKSYFIELSDSKGCAAVDSEHLWSAVNPKISDPLKQINPILPAYQQLYPHSLPGKVMGE